MLRPHRWWQTMGASGTTSIPASRAANTSARSAQPIAARDPADARPRSAPQPPRAHTESTAPLVFPPQPLIEQLSHPAYRRIIQIAILCQLREQELWLTTK